MSWPLRQRDTPSNRSDLRRWPPFLTLASDRSRRMTLLPNGRLARRIRSVGPAVGGGRHSAPCWPSAWPCSGTGPRDQAWTLDHLSAAQRLPGLRRLKPFSRNGRFSRRSLHLRPRPQVHAWSRATRLPPVWSAGSGRATKGRLPAPACRCLNVCSQHLLLNTRRSAANWPRCRCHPRRRNSFLSASLYRFRPRWRRGPSCGDRARRPVPGLPIDAPAQGATSTR